MFKELQSNEVLVCIVCFILGYMIYRYFGANNGFSIGAVPSPPPEQDRNRCKSLRTYYYDFLECIKNINNKELWRTEEGNKGNCQMAYEDFTKYNCDR